MANMKRTNRGSATAQPRTFAALLKGRPKSVQQLARAIRTIVYEEIPDAQEGGLVLDDERTRSDCHPSVMDSTAGVSSGISQHVTG